MLTVTAALAAVLVGPRAARAEPPPVDPGERAHRGGKQAFADGDYQAAAQRFDEAYRLSGDPIHLFNLAQAQRLAGDCRAARHSYRAFLDRMPDAPNRADVEGKIAALERCARPPVRLTPAPVPTAVADAAPLAVPRRPERRARTRRLGITVAVISALTMAAAVGAAAAEPDLGMPVALVAIPVGLGLVTGGVIRQVSDNRRAAADDL
jgi:hypothetical protein